MKIFLRWEYILYKRYAKIQLIDPFRVPSLIVILDLKLDATVNSIRSEAGLPSHPDRMLQTTLTGTVTLTQNSDTITGVGTAFTTELTVGDFIYWNGGRSWAEVATIASDTSMTITSPYEAQTQAGITLKESTLRDRGTMMVWETDPADDYGNDDLIPVWAQSTYSSLGPFDPSDCI